MMQVTNPQEPFMNLPTEDVFVAVNDAGVQHGYGYVMYQYQPSVYPDKPVNIFFTMECTPEAEYLLFGALVARARHLRSQNPGVGARMYTSVTPGDARKLSFYEHNGLSISNSEDQVRLSIPEDLGAEMFNCSIIPLPLNTPQEAAGLVDRLRANGLGHITSSTCRCCNPAPCSTCGVCSTARAWWASASSPAAMRPARWRACTSCRNSSTRAWASTCSSARWALWVRRA